MNFLDDVISGRRPLPMLPSVIGKVLQLLREENASFSMVASEIEQDPVLSARVLRLSNSSYFAGRRSITSIKDSVLLVGVKTLQILVISCGAQAVFAEVPGVNLRQFWITSAMTAAASRQIAYRLGLDRETAYGAGLLKAVGHLILCQAYPKLASDEFTSVRDIFGISLAERERKIFGADHAEVSALWVKRLGVPEVMVDAISKSCQRMQTNDDPISKTVQMACIMVESASACGSSQEAKIYINDFVHDQKLSSYLETDEFSSDYDVLKSMAV